MPQIDPFLGRVPGEAQPYENVLTVTPSDTIELPVIPSAICLPVSPSDAGNHALRVELLNGEITTVIAGAQQAFGFAGAALPLRVRRIFATGTTAPRVCLFW